MLHGRDIPRLRCETIVGNRMQRQTARFLLLLFVVGGAFAPLLEALSAKQPHACCLRRLHNAKNAPAEVHDADQMRGNCCPPLTTPHAARLLSVAGSAALFHSSQLTVASANSSPSSKRSDEHLSRAPPALS